MAWPCWFPAPLFPVPLLPVPLLEIARRGEADADSLIKDLQDQLAELEAAQAKLEELDRRAADPGRPQDAALAAGKLVAVQQQLARCGGCCRA